MHFISEHKSLRVFNFGCWNMSTIALFQNLNFFDMKLTFFCENLQNIIQFTRSRLVISYTEMIKKSMQEFSYFGKKILLLQQNITEHRFLLIKYLPELKRGISRNRRLEELKMTNPFLHIMEKYIFPSILAT